MTFLLLMGIIALFAVVVQPRAVVAQVPSATPRAPSDTTPRELAFTTPEADVSREGYVMIEWTEYPGEVGYRLVDEDQIEVYRGPFPKAFVSGLPDGEHAFHAAAFDESGAVLARTPEPYRVTVEHWSLRQAWLLFSIGLIVFLALVVVLLRGAVGAGEAALESKQLSPDRSPEAKE